MSVLTLLNQTISVYGKSSYNSEGREVLGSATSVKARIQPKQKTRILANGGVVIIDATAFVPADTSINIDDKVSFGGNDYKVFNKYAVPDGGGVTSHIELELMKWQST